ncbi:MAG: PKD domain-containing protein [Cytophagaceae bacterium]|nr:PKD domain-containing protein [Gemmatimonadaceae bacterium]
MIVRQRGRAFLLGVALVAGVSCGKEQTGVGGDLEAPRALEVQAVGTSSVRLSWDRVTATNVTGYEVQRRVDLKGEFTTLAGNIPQAPGRISFFDNDVVPDTYYGYRVMALTSFGAHSAPSTVGGAKTPPPPTLIVAVATVAPNDGSVDTDGYVARILGPRDTLTAAMATNGERRFSSIRAGTYTIVLRGLASNCDFSTGDSLKTAQVVDVGTLTEVLVRYNVSCRDPKKGSLVIRYEQEGDTTDPNGVRLSITGLLTEADPVDTSRVYARTETIASRIANFRYDNLRGGPYEIALDDIAPVCSIQGSRRRAVTVRALSLDTVRFNGVCTRPVVVDTAGKPLVLEHAWSSGAAPNGSKVSLTTTIDTRARPTQRFSGISYDIGYSQAALRFDSARKVEIGTLAVNGVLNPGLVVVAGLETDPGGFGDRLVIGRVWFTVIGQTGAATRTSTTLKSLRTVGTGSTEEVSKLRAQEATFTVGTVSPNQNVTPIARANGPYAATVGIATQLSGIGSNDPDGTISAYRWDFGDGTPPATTETAQHVYATAGTFTAALTVTDNRGATATDQAQVTVTNSGTPNQPPVARISAPGTGTPGTSLTFSGTQSSDADGTIQSYEWAFGDGATGTGPTTAHVYAAAGTFNVTLRVTDNRGASHTAQHVVTVTPSNPGTTPFAWTGTFGTMDPVTKAVDLTLTLDLSSNITETPGAEELGSYIVDSLKWDPVVLKLEAFNFGPGQQQAIDQSDVARGKLRFSGSTLAGQNSGVLTIARLRFTVRGGSGARVTTQTVVGPLIGTPATGSYNYRPKVEVKEGTLVVP